MKRIKKCLKHIFQIPYLEHHVKWKNNEFGRKPMTTVRTLHRRTVSTV